MSHKPKDMELWHRVARSAKPLRGRDRHAVYSPLKQADSSDAGEAAPRRKTTDSPTSAPRRAAGGNALPAAAAKAGAAPETAKHRQPCLAHGQVAGVDRRTAERLKRGRMAVEARLDLHGLTQAEAHRALDAFVAASYDAGRRCLLVITGKGQGKQEGGVLRGKVPLWLNQAPNRGRVLAFDYAQQRDGGTGALYVMLRRKR